MKSIRFISTLILLCLTAFYATDSVLGQMRRNCLSDLPFGKTVINNGRLTYIPTVQTRQQTTSSVNEVKQYIKFENLSSNNFKMEFISVSPTITQGIKFSSTQNVVLCCDYNGKSKSAKKKPFNLLGDLLGGPKIEVRQVITTSDDADDLEIPPSADNSKKKNKSEEINLESKIPFKAVIIQQSNAPIRYIVLQSNSELVEFNSNSIWELLVQVPPTYQPPLKRMLEFFDGKAEFANLIHRTFNAISKVPKQDENLQQSYQKWVAQLSSDNYMERFQAQENLQKAGSPAIQYMQTIDKSKLDPETMIRISALLNSTELSVESDDIEAISTWFTGKTYALIPLLESSNPPFYQTAENKLKEHLKDQYQFDKNAKQETKDQQLNKMKALLGFPQAKITDLKNNKDLKESFESFLKSAYSENSPLETFP